MIDKLWKILTSLRLTVTLLACGIVLVFIGTVAQADEGLYVAQARYFKHWYVYGITMFGKHLPVPLPGGYLIGSLLVLNLVLTYIKRFKFTTRTIGIHLTHIGIILLLVGQLVTDLFSRESQMRFAEGESRSFSDNPMEYELVFLTDTDAQNQRVVTIPEARLVRGGEVRHAELPFTVQVKSYWKNSEPAFRAPMQQSEPQQASQGLSKSFDFRKSPTTATMDAKNVATALIELTGPNGSLGTWMVSGWSSDDVMLTALRRGWERQMGPQLATKVFSQFTEPQTVEVGGKKYTLALRPERYYLPYSLTLLKTTHEIYRGTDIPKNFQSRVRIENPRTSENRETDIFMNNPLRYEGLTYYQYQMGRDEIDAARGTSTLQVVLNPGWLTPYAGCVLVACGLVFQFMLHLVGFINKRKAGTVKAAA